MFSIMKFTFLRFLSSFTYFMARYSISFFSFLCSSCGTYSSESLASASLSIRFYSTQYFFYLYSIFPLSNFQRQTGGPFGFFSLPFYYFLKPWSSYSNSQGQSRLTSQGLWSKNFSRICIRALAFDSGHFVIFSNFRPYETNFLNSDDAVGNFDLTIEISSQVQTVFSVKPRTSSSRQYS